MPPLAGEAVQDAAQTTGRPVFAKYVDGVIPGVLTLVRGARMNSDGRPRGAGLLHLPAKDLFVPLARRVVVKIIQADLAPGQDLGMLGKPLHLRVVALAGQLGFMRMDT